jgi:hypothetical protein
MENVEGFSPKLVEQLKRSDKVQKEEHVDDPNSDHFVLAAHEQKRDAGQKYPVLDQTQIDPVAQLGLNDECVVVVGLRRAVASRLTFVPARVVHSFALLSTSLVQVLLEREPEREQERVFGS